ncbi:type VI secretion system baseplate subunit TssK, partial [Pseudomonas sp. NPDC098747]|uniref:type VI secretion system baseplate subunit TssK n=1 Tax=Pseudomonas sp. NPDC098747 TaxID=3364487 RepID=UPI00383A1848
NDNKNKQINKDNHHISIHYKKTKYILELSSEDLAQLERSGGFAFHVSGEFAELELKFWAIRN